MSEVVHWCWVPVSQLNHGVTTYNTLCGSYRAMREESSGQVTCLQCVAHSMQRDMIDIWDGYDWRPGT